MIVCIIKYVVLQNYALKSKIAVLSNHGQHAESIPVAQRIIDRLEDDIVGIRQTEDGDIDDAWYDLGGRRLEGMPSRGIYIHNGRKVVVQ